MQICHIIRRVTRDLKRTQGVAPGEGLGARRKKINRKKTFVSKLRKSKATPARDTEARTRQEKKIVSKKRWKYRDLAQ